MTSCLLLADPLSAYQMRFTRVKLMASNTTITRCFSRMAALASLDYRDILNSSIIRFSRNFGLISKFFESDILMAIQTAVLHYMRLVIKSRPQQNTLIFLHSQNSGIFDDVARLAFSR